LMRGHAAGFAAVCGGGAVCGNGIDRHRNLPSIAL
jgi:hypothetical protein